MSIDLASLRPLFAPASVAVIGASSDPLKISGRPVQFLKLHEFAGPVYPVNPNAETIQGLTSYPSVRDVGAPIDMAVLAVPARLAEAAIADCAMSGVRAVVMFTSGFAEIDEAGRQQQERIRVQAAEAGIRLMGPNCMGIINFRHRMAATFHPAFEFGVAPGGRIGLVSQSGAFGGLAYYMALQRGVAFSHCMTTGNEADVEASDCLAYLAQDADTEVIMLYLEGCRNGEKLLAALELARQAKKPVVAIKLGRTEAGAEAARSHTAALAGADAVFDAVFRQYGVYRAHSIEEFFDIGCAAAIGRLPRNNRVGLVTVSGGVGVLMADDAAARGLDVAVMPEAAQAEVKGLVPFAGVRNPVDVTGQVINDRSLLERTLRILLSDGGYASAVCFQGSSGIRPEAGEQLCQAMLTLNAEFPETPLALAGFITEAFRTRLQDAGCLVYEEPTHATRAMAALSEFRQALDQVRPWPEVSAPATALPKGKMNEVAALAVLAQAGVPVIEERLATSADEAADHADAIGYPVVMKVVAAEVLHKTDVGGVVLGIEDRAGAERAYGEIMERVAAALPQAEVDGCLVAPMAPAGVQAVLGVHQDATFGPVVMFGLGGILIEHLKDVTFRVAPFDEAEAMAMIGEIRGASVLEGARGRPPADIPALATALADLSLFAAQHAREIETLDINPFLILPEGQGALALDAVLITRS